MHRRIIEKAEQIIESNLGVNTHCTLALMDSDGFPTISTITASKADGMNWITFCTGINSNKVNRIRKSDRASVCFNASDYNITLIGTIEVITDVDVKRSMWYDGLQNHFKGPDDPELCVLKFRTTKYSLLIDWEEVQGILSEQ